MPQGDVPAEPGARRWRWRWMVSSLVSVVALTALLGFGLGRDPTELPSVLVGKAAPAFALQDMRTGREVRLADLRGHVVVLNFWASWCVECVQEHPGLVAAWQRFGDSRVVFLSVLYQDRRDAAVAFGRRYGQPWPSLLDPGGRTALAFGVSGVPETFFIGPDGRIAAKQVGPTSYDLLASRIRALLPRGSA
jgi:cytochrome c biogenesis protein CcmG/thiol:disulfide interchange protein DsbE